MKEVRKFLNKRPPMQVEIMAPRGERTIGYLLKDRLAILNHRKTILYPLSYVDSYHYSKGIPNGHVVFGDILYKLDDVIEYELIPDRFMEELMYSQDADVEDWYIITIDGIEVNRSTSSYKSNRARNQYLKERKRGSIDFGHLKQVDPAGNRTDFTFDRT